MEKSEKSNLILFRIPFEETIEEHEPTGVHLKVKQKTGASQKTSPEIDATQPFKFKVVSMAKPDEPDESQSKYLKFSEAEALPGLVFRCTVEPCQALLDDPKFNRIVSKDFIVTVRVKLKPKQTGGQQEELSARFRVKVESYMTIHWEWKSHPLGFPDQSGKNQPIVLQPDGKSWFKLKVWTREWVPAKKALAPSDPNAYEFSHWIAPGDSKMTIDIFAPKPLPWEVPLRESQAENNWYSKTDLPDSSSFNYLPIDTCIRVKAWNKGSIKVRKENDVDADQEEMGEVEIPVRLVKTYTLSIAVLLDENQEPLKTYQQEIVTGEKVKIYCPQLPTDLKAKIRWKVIGPSHYFIGKRKFQTEEKDTDLAPVTTPADEDCLGTEIDIAQDPCSEAKPPVYLDVKPPNPQLKFRVFTVSPSGDKKETNKVNTDGQSYVIITPHLTLFEEEYKGGIEVGELDAGNWDKYFADQERLKEGQIESWKLRCRFHFQEDEAIEQLGKDRTIKISFPVKVTDEKYRNMLPDDIKPKPSDAAVLHLFPSKIEFSAPKSDVNGPELQSLPDSNYGSKIIFTATVKTTLDPPVPVPGSAIKKDSQSDTKSWRFEFTLNPPANRRCGCQNKVATPRTEKIQAVEVDNNGQIWFEHNSSSKGEPYCEYNHLKVVKKDDFKTKEGEHLKGNDGYLIVTFIRDKKTIPIKKDGSEVKIPIKVEEPGEVAKYVIGTFGHGNGDKIPVNAAKDPRVEWFQENDQEEPHCLFVDEVNKKHEFFYCDSSGNNLEGMVRVPNTATDDFYCHDLPWRPEHEKCGRVTGNQFPVNRVLADLEKNGYEEIVSSYLSQGSYWGGRVANSYIDYLRQAVGKPEYVDPGLPEPDPSTLKIGDIVIYINSPSGLNSPDHSALVEQVVGSEVHLMSKDVDNSIFRHRLGVKGNKNYFRDRYGNIALRFFRKK